MSRASTQHLQAFSSGDVTFKLQLNCLARKSSEVQLLRLTSFPASVSDIKKAIEDEFSIPACVQTLSYHSIPLTHSGSIMGACKHIRSGDMLTVDFSCEADVKKIDEIVDWVKEVTLVLRGVETVASEADSVILRGARNKYDVVLALEIFDWLDAKAYVNKIYFLESGGLDAVVALYKYVLDQQWEEMSRTCRYIEAFCSHTCANFGETLYLRRVLAQQDGLEMATRSLLRVIAAEDQDFERQLSSQSDEYSRYALKRTLENALHIICNLSELPECQIPIASNDLIISQALRISLSDSFHATISVLVSELFLCLAHNTGAHCCLSKPHVIQALYEACEKRHAGSGSSRKGYLLSTALRCFTNMVFAQIAVASPHLIPVPAIRSIAGCMHSFLCTANPADIRDYEEDLLCVWATFLPYLKLFYLPVTRLPLLHCSAESTASPGPSDSRRDPTSPFPSSVEGKLAFVNHACASFGGASDAGLPGLQRSSSSLRPGEEGIAFCQDSPRQKRALGLQDKYSEGALEHQGVEQASLDASEHHGIEQASLEALEASHSKHRDLESLKQASLNTILFFLLTKVTRECHCKVLQEEDLVDFVTCLPWHVGVASRERAEQVVWELNTHLKLQPPRLFNLAKVVLARMHFGLEKTVTIHSPMELAREMLDDQ